MNTVFIALIVFTLFFIAYRFYASRIERLFDVNPEEKTPAYEKSDGVDYVPAKSWIMLFGHHFSSIAGAAPIVGPIIALCLWGWLPSIVWIIVGSIFIGGVHDFSALMVSVKNGGASIADVAGNTISRRAKLVFSIFVLLTLILVVSVFLYLCAMTFVADGKVVVPSLGLVFVAILTGILIYRLKSNQFFSTLLGLLLLALLIILGRFFPIELGKNSMQIWMIVLLVYAYFASIIPVNILLQPRDYLSSFLLVIGIVLGYAGIFISHPHTNLPAFTIWNSASGWLWPMMVVTIACGAVSGFHSLIASGTTSKQISSQKYGKRIVYGAMLMEGVLAVLALLVVAGGMKSLTSARSVLNAHGPIGLFSKGFGIITLPILGKFGPLVAVLILNAFILTTLDTATRISRYVIEELTGIRNRWLSTLVIVIISGWLAWGGRWKAIWPVFGASNQLLATIALFIVSCWLLGKKKQALYTLIPGFFMLVTTIGALVYQLLKYLKNNDWILFVISGLLFMLAVYMFIEILKALRNIKKL